MRIVKLICIALSAWLVYSGIASSTAMAQGVIDIDPPVIELDETREGIAGETQVFTALVTDELALRDVKLYYRFAGDETYSEVLMSQLGDTNYYSANVSTLETETRTIEYYIQARDGGGNRVIKGFAFEPYLRHLTLPEPALEATAAPEESDLFIAEKETTQPSPESKKGGVNWWYLVLGVIAAGGIAAAAGGGGGSNGGGGPAQQVPVTFNVDNP